MGYTDRNREAMRKRAAAPATKNIPRLFRGLGISIPRATKNSVMKKSRMLTIFEMISRL